MATSSSSDWKDRHLWQIQPVRDVLLVFTLFALVSLGSVLSLLTVPLLLALLFAYLFDPVVTRLTRISWMSRSLASVCIIIGLAVLVVLPAIIGLGFGILQGIELVGSLGDKAVLLQTALTSFGEEQGRAVAQLDGAFVVASDSHANMYGALGALGTPVVRTDAAASSSQLMEMADAVMRATPKARTGPARPRALGPVR